MKYFKYSSLIIFVMLIMLSGCVSMKDLNEIAKLTGNQDIIEGVQVVSKVSDAMKDFTPEEEYYIGRAAAASILGKYPLYEKNQELVTYLNMIGNTLALSSPRPYLFKGYYFMLLDNDNLINAYATPGGHIFITTGLLKLCNNEDELAAILAHEIAHIANKDALNAISSAKKMEAITAILKFGVRKVGQEYAADYIGEITGLFDGISNQVTDAVMNGFSKEQEYAADTLGARILAQSGYSPITMKDVILKLPSDLTGHYKSHPKPSARVSTLDKLIMKSNLSTDIYSKRTDRFSKLNF